MKIEDLYKLLIKFQQDFLAFRQEMSEFRKETKDELNKHSKALVGIENTLNFYGDMYKINKDGIQTLDKRITILESSR
jgi:hypothetical protein